MQFLQGSITALTFVYCELLSKAENSDPMFCSLAKLNVKVTSSLDPVYSRLNLNKLYVGKFKDMTNAGEPRSIAMKLKTLTFECELERNCHRVQSSGSAVNIIRFYLLFLKTTQVGNQDHSFLHGGNF